VKLIPFVASSHPSFIIHCHHPLSSFTVIIHCHHPLSTFTVIIHCHHLLIDSLLGQHIAQITIPLDPTTRTSKGLAYITYVSSASAISAFDDLDRHSFQGRLLHILPAIVRNAKPDINVPGAGGSGSVKQDREEAKKKDTKGLSWGTLFMNVRLASSPLLSPPRDVH
jgi:RNA recognition motif-containing protein